MFQARDYHAGKDPCVQAGHLEPYWIGLDGLRLMQVNLVTIPMFGRQELSASSVDRMSLDPQLTELRLHKIVFV